jgi:hypothetical protein
MGTVNPVVCCRCLRHRQAAASGSASPISDMSDETIRSKTNTALWFAAAICLMPLVPYALGGLGG